MELNFKLTLNFQPWPNIKLEAQQQQEIRQETGDRKDTSKSPWMIRSEFLWSLGCSGCSKRIIVLISQLSGLIYPNNTPTPCLPTLFFSAGTTRYRMQLTVRISSRDYSYVKNGWRRVKIRLSFEFVLLSLSSPLPHHILQVYRRCSKKILILTGTLYTGMESSYPLPPCGWCPPPARSPGDHGFV